VKLGEIFRFELAYQLRRVPTWLYFAVLLFIAFFQTTRTFLPDALSGGYFLSAPLVVAQIAAIDCLIWLLLAAYVAGDAGARDVETGLHPLIYTAPVSKADYLGGRFLAAFVLNAGLLLAVTAGMLIGLYSGQVEAAVRGPFRPGAYLTVYLIIALPTVFVTTAIQFSFAALSRRAIASYVGGILLLVTALVATTVLAPLLKPEVVRLLDLFGIIAVEEWGDAATPAQLNTQLTGLKGSWLASRLLWVCIALCALAFTYVRFRPGHPSARTRGSRIARRSDAHSPASADMGALRTAPISIPPVPRAFGLAARARQTLAIAWTSFASISTTWSGLVLLTVVGLLATVTVFESPGNLGVPLLLRTDYVLNNLTFPDVPPAYLIIPLLIVFWSGELVWREREAGVSEILDAAPVPEWVLLLGKFLGLALVLALCMGLRMLVGVTAQVSAGYSGLEIGPYLQVLFGLQLADYLLLAVLGLVIHVVVNQKHVGHLATLIASVLSLLGTELTIVHQLLVYGSTPGWSYTDMRGFGGSVAPWLWYKLYWGTWALLFLGAARLLWVRGREGGFGVRLRIARRRFTQRTAWAATGAVGLVLATGGFIYYDTDVVNERATADERMKQLAEYERRYGRFEGIPQPLLTRTNLHVEIYPDQRAVEIRGTYQLVNRTGVAIDSIQLATASDVETGEVTFDRPAATAVADDELGHRIYALETPLRPGDSLELDFEVRFEPRGFASRGIQAPVAANGTNFSNAWLPAIGYQPFRELSDAEVRRAYGLAPRPPIPSLDDPAARNDMTGVERIAFEAVVGTDDNQTAVAPGTLRRTWTEGGRRYFHYIADGPIGNEYFFFSADYTLHEERWNGVAIQIFHHPESGANLERLVRSIRASLDYCTEQFGPYPHSYLRLVAIPGQGVGLRAETSTITYREGFALLRPEDDSRGFDLVFVVLAHEVGHLCGAVSYARVEGAGVMSETLAWYRALGVVKEAHGQEHLRRLLSWMRESYMIPPVRAAVPLLRGGGEYAVNRRGPFAMYALSEYIGEDRVNAALRRLREAHSSAEPPLPTTLDLYRELQAVTPDSLKYLLHDLFAANTLWELETVRAVAEETGAGAWQVTLDVRARKVVVDTADIETDVPMDDLVQIGVFAGAEGGQASGGPLYLRMHRVRAGDQTITVTVPRKPTRAGIDPYHLLVDLEVDDNLRDVTTTLGPRR
jgi:ABC-2 type transport system permease protein